MCQNLNKMTDQIERERRAMERQWKEREGQIRDLNSVMSSTYGLVASVVDQIEVPQSLRLDPSAKQKARLLL